MVRVVIQLGTLRSCKDDGQKSPARSEGEICDLIFTFYKVSWWNRGVIQVERDLGRSFSPAPWLKHGKIWDSNLSSSKCKSEALCPILRCLYVIRFLSATWPRVLLSGWFATKTSRLLVNANRVLSSRCNFLIARAMSQMEGCFSGGKGLL